jgi:hypothetical protein
VDPAGTERPSPNRADTSVRLVPQFDVYVVGGFLRGQQIPQSAPAARPGPRAARQSLCPAVRQRLELEEQASHIGEIVRTQVELA